MESHKPFRKKTAGARVRRREQQVERHNPRAFTFSGGHESVRRRVQRGAEVAEKRLRFQPSKDKAVEALVDAPPQLVVVHGPPGCGKSTLIKSLVKHYTHKSVATLAGPVTCVSGKARRLTFAECNPHDIAAAIDLAKLADLAILMIDCRKGIELDTFEFINLMQNHGMPKVIGVLTHIDQYRDDKVLRKLKKKMKQRFWAELYDGAKLFYLSGLKGKRYLARDTINLARFIATTKFEPVFWRSQHPYLLALGVEVEQVEDEEATCSFTGYIKGAPARNNYVLHIPGCGDFTASNITLPEDPCPLPTKKIDLRKQGEGVRHLYAPMCHVGSMALEGTSVFVTMPKNDNEPQVSESESEDEEPSVLQKPTTRSSGWDTDSDSNDAESQSTTDTEADDEEEVDEAGEAMVDDVPRDVLRHLDEKVWDQSSNDNSDVHSDDELENLNEYLEVAPETPKWSSLIYESNGDTQEQTAEDNLWVAQQEEEDVTRQPDTELDAYLNAFKADDNERKADEDELYAILRVVCFMTGGWESGDDELSRIFENEEATLSTELDLGWTIPVGRFVRLTLKGMSREWVEELNRAPRPVLIGGVKPSENSLTFIHARVRRHRWSPGIMKSTEPLLFSIGWRRFQSLPYFAMEDRDSVRNRYLKYTPEHLHCQMYVHGFATPPGAGVVGIKYTSRNTTEWRISVVGSVVENIAQPRVLKKVKLMGGVEEVMKNTAMVKGMFNSDLEVSRCLGACIQTQAGVRGIIKKPRGDKGVYRATFEAPINKTDLVICKAWYRVAMEPYCNPMLDVASWDKLATFAEIRQRLGASVTQKAKSEYEKRRTRAEPKARPLRLPKAMLSALSFSELESRTPAATLAPATKPVVKYTGYEQMVQQMLVKARQQKTEQLAANYQKIDARRAREADAAAALEEQRLAKRRRVSRPSTGRGGGGGQRGRSSSRGRH